LTKFDKHIFSEHFISKIALLLKDYVAPAKIDKFLFLLEKRLTRKYFSPSVEYNIQRLLETNYDKIGFVFDSFRYPHYSDILIAIASGSNFLTEIVIKNPEYLYMVLQPENLSQKLVIKNLQKKIASKISRFNSFNSKLNIIKAFKRRYILLIGMQDILKIFDLPQITQQISILAKVLLSELFNCCIEETAKRNSINIPKIKHCLIALGKLGGKELNYSSDVDLMLFYDKNSKVGGKKSLEYYDFITQVIQLFSSSSTNIDGKGFLYRIDFRLRPDGKSSPLCRTFPDTIKYYETRGEDWEKQMLIKSGFINGNRQLFEQFEKYLHPFIFSNASAVSPLLQIARMKKNIEHQFPDEKNIKLCRGGIRDIEFVIQALQIINGNKFPELKTGNSLNALSLLLDKNLIQKKEKQTLEGVYIFYRKIEHTLQLDSNKQVHTIPSDNESLTKLYQYLGFENETDFLNTVVTKKRTIASLFDRITGKQKPASASNTKLNEIIFCNKKRALLNFRFIQKGVSSVGQKTFDNKTIFLFSNFESYLLRYLKTSKAPDKILENFAKVLRNISFPSILYSEFKNQKFLQLFLKLCEFSQKAVDMMSVDKSLIDFFITRNVFTKNYSCLYKSISAEKFIFILAVQLAIKLITPEQISELLSDFIRKKIKLVSDKIKIECNYFAGGLGSFGINEMSFSSDVDLLFVSRNVNNTYNLQKDFEKLVFQINKEISPFKVDLRLRPEGNKGPLVWDMNKLSLYFSSRARIWEYQSLNKLSFVYGNKKLFNSFRLMITDNISRLNKADVQKNIRFMRTKLKQSQILLDTLIDFKNNNGALYDLNFYIDSFTLEDKSLYFQTIGKSRKSILENITKDKELTELYSLLKNFEIIDQNISNSTNSKLPSNPQENILLDYFYSFNSKNEIVSGLKKLLEYSSKKIREKL